MVLQEKELSALKADFIQQFFQLRKRAIAAGHDQGLITHAFLSPETVIRKHDVLPADSKPEEEEIPILCSKLVLALLVSAIALPIIICMGFKLAEHGFNPVSALFSYRHDRCIIDASAVLSEAARPLFDCRKCENMTEIAATDTLTKEEFLQKYAYTDIPVLVKKATVGWTAMSVFSFKYFKTIYESNPEALDVIEEECQFFPYKTDMGSLREVFTMSKARAQFADGEEEWYIGWSNCHPDIAEQLRQHYRRPHFLPENSESSELDWIFMGGFGEGADMHVDSVQRPSWQAQISGRKTWTVQPPPECESACHTMTVTLESGDIFVINTNQWYHSTYVHPGDICISIGSEYD